MTYSLYKCPEKGMTTVEEPPPLPIHTLSPCLCKSFPSISFSFIHVLLHLILPSYNWPTSPIRIFNFNHIYFLHKLFTSYFLTSANIIYGHLLNGTFFLNPVLLIVCIYLVVYLVVVYGRGVISYCPVFFILLYPIWL